MGILISKKACSVIKVFVVTAIIKMIIMTRANNNNNDNNSNNNNSNNNNKQNFPETRKYWVDVQRGIVSSYGERDPL